MEEVFHPFEPVVSEDSRILILGSFPSVRSREMKFYYGHPRNRFWKLMSELLCESEPLTTDEKKSLIIRHGLAVWDTLACCEIQGSADASIRKEQPNDIPGLVRKYGIRAILFNGNASYKYYLKYFKTHPELEKVILLALPSTSPANAAMSLDRLKEVWGRALAGLDNEIGRKDA